MVGGRGAAPRCALRPRAPGVPALRQRWGSNSEARRRVRAARPPGGLAAAAGGSSLSARPPPSARASALRRPRLPRRRRRRAPGPRPVPLGAAPRASAPARLCAPLRSPLSPARIFSPSPPFPSPPLPSFPLPSPRPRALSLSPRVHSHYWSEGSRGKCSPGGPKGKRVSSHLSYPPRTSSLPSDGPADSLICGGGRGWVCPSFPLCACSPGDEGSRSGLLLPDPAPNPSLQEVLRAQHQEVQRPLTCPGGPVVGIPGCTGPQDMEKEKCVGELRTHWTRSQVSHLLMLAPGLTSKTPTGSCTWSCGDEGVDCGVA
ncbi:uncharacterized protein LOC134808993 [Pan troglodytes]|uniref:uncharacterized protein LOC134808993 n=1 Tax=Pan troglodytes TaxID=9598 RepID=UPI0030138088